MEYAPCAEWRLIIALWRFGGLRRNEPLALRWGDVNSKVIRVRSSKKKDERIVPIFPEIAGPLSQVRAEAKEQGRDAADHDWVIVDACPKKYRNGPRNNGLKDANLVTVFEKTIMRRAGLESIPMLCNNFRASIEKDLYSGKYPELRGRVDLIGKILGHSPQVALQYYSRFCEDDFDVLTASFSVGAVGAKSGAAREKTDRTSDNTKIEVLENTALETMPRKAKQGENALLPCWYIHLL